MKHKGVIGQTLKPELCYPNDGYKESAGKLPVMCVSAILSSVCVIILFCLAL